MRVDTTAADTAAFDSLDALTRLKGYISALRRRWYLVFLPMILGAGIGWITAPQAPGKVAPILAGPTYYRAAHVLIDENQGTASGSDTTPVNLTQAAYLVNTGDIPERVATKLKLPVDDVASSLIGLPRTSVASVEVQAVGTDQRTVVSIADTAASELLVTLEQQAKANAESERDRILDQLDKLDRQITDINGFIAKNPSNRSQLEAQQRSLTNQYSLVYEQFSQLANRPAPTAGLTSLEGAKAVKISESEYDRTKKTIRDGADYVTGVTPTTVPAGTDDDAAPSEGASATTRALFGALTGLAMGIGLVLLLDRYDSRLRSRATVEAATGLAVLAEIPPLTRQQQNTNEVVAHTKLRSRAAEAYRVVRGAMLFNLEHGEHRHQVGHEATVVMVTSASPIEGKTTTVANLAAVLAEGGFNVLVINCDFRRPSVHKYLTASGEANEKGTAEVARFGSVVVTNTIMERVQLVTGLGENDPDANPLQVLALQRKVIQATRSSFDMILLDTAPLLTTNDASELLPETDQVLLVVRSGKTKVEAARRVAEVLDRFDAPVIGVVMNDSTEATSAQYYYGDYTTERTITGRLRGSGDSTDDGNRPAPTDSSGRTPSSPVGTP